MILYVRASGGAEELDELDELLDDELDDEELDDELEGAGAGPIAGELVGVLRFLRFLDFFGAVRIILAPSANVVQGSPSALVALLPQAPRIRVPGWQKRVRREAPEPIPIRVDVRRVEQVDHRHILRNDASDLAVLGLSLRLTR